MTKRVAMVACAAFLVFGCAEQPGPGELPETFTIEASTPAPAAGKADSAYAQSCHYRCTNTCPKDAYCLAVCIAEEYGNCSQTCDGVLQLCKEGYSFNPAKCDCQPTGPKGGCFYDNKWHAAGTSFKAGDGCNTCWCGDNGLVACTKIACAEPDHPTDPCKDPARSYVSTDPDQCAAIKFLCAEPTVPFFDECGCGCW